MPTGNKLFCVICKPDFDITNKAKQEIPLHNEGDLFRNYLGLTEAWPQESSWEERANLEAKLSTRILRIL